MKADILLIEDNPVVQKLVTRLLEKEGYNVSILSSGKNAVDTIKAEKPALIILDIMLPEVDGFTICSEIKGDNSLKNIPILILSAVTKGLNDTTTEESMKFKTDADAFMSKPFKPNELLLNVKRLLRKRMIFYR